MIEEVMNEIVTPVFCVCLVIVNGIHLVHLFRCRKVKHCVNRECKHSYWCRKYDKRCTPEETQRLYELIDAYAEERRREEMRTETMQENKL